MASTGILTVLVSVLSPTSSAPTTTMSAGMSSAILNEEAGKVDLHSLSFLIRTVIDNTDYSATLLDDHCNSLADDDFPPEFGKTKCREYAAYTGTQHVTCNRPISDPAVHNGINRPIQTTGIEAMDSLLAHSAMIKGLREIPAYSSTPSQCHPIDSSDPNYFICKLLTTQSKINLSKDVLESILSDLETPETSIPAEMTCQADASVAKKAPLGILWKIESDSKVHLTNLRNVCEFVKHAQGQQEFTCP